MTTMRDNLTAEPAGKIEKIKTPFATVIVSGLTEPYYSVMWWDATEKVYNIGYSSYNLDYAREWLKERFEADNNAKHPFEITLDDLWPKGRWVFAGDGAVECSACRECVDSDLFPRNFCPNCGADMRGGQL